MYEMIYSLILSACQTVLRLWNSEYCRVCRVSYMLGTLMIYLFTNTCARARYDTRSYFKQSLTGLNSELSFSKTSLSYYLPIAGGRIIGFIPFPRVLVLCEMQSFSSRIWTRVAVSIFYDDNHYTTGTSNNIKYYFQIQKKKNK